MAASDTSAFSPMLDHHSEVQNQAKILRDPAGAEASQPLGCSDGEARG
jgi:hypothetical protein